MEAELWKQLHESVEQSHSSQFYKMPESQYPATYMELEMSLGEERHGNRHEEYAIPSLASRWRYCQEDGDRDDHKQSRDTHGRKC